MPSAPLRYCSAPGCPEKVAGKRCDQHRTEAKQRQQLVSDPGVHYGRKWKTRRLAYLANHPFCIKCEAEGEQTIATEVDHVIPHRGSAVLFWDDSNWQPLCKPHHSAKTAREVSWHGA